MEKTMPQEKFIKRKKIKVLGAGEIAISEDSNSVINGTFGFNFGVSWGRHGFIGGVLPREGARQLANHILQNIEKQN